MAPPYRFVRPPADYPGPRYMPSCRVLEHHLVYWQNTGKLIPDGFVVHHRDDVGTNNAFENLELIERAEHGRLHNLLSDEYLELSCSHCGVAIKRTARDVRSKQKQGQGRFFCSSAHAALAGHADLGIREPKHGTSSQYGKGCRCQACRQYNSARQHRAKIKASGAIS